MPRRSRRNGIEDSKPPSASKTEQDEENENIDIEEAEEEITRCYCGQAEYPGPTQHAKEMAKGTPRM
jgi:hypothetical protein